MPSCIDCPTPGTRHATFLIPSGVKLYSGFHGVLDPNDRNDLDEQNLHDRDEVLNRTILSGDIGAPGYRPDDAYHVVTAVNVSALTKLSGFTIEYGNANSADPNNSFERVGGGILIIGTRDGWINLTDLAMLLTVFGSHEGTCPVQQEDIDRDGDVDLTDLAMLPILYDGPCEGNSMPAGDDPLSQWLRSATPQQVLDWWNAGMPPVGGNEQ